MEGRMRSPKQKKGISITLDVPLLEWLSKTAEKEALSVSYLINRFCSIAKEALHSRVVFPDRKEVSTKIRKRGLKDKS